MKIGIDMTCLLEKPTGVDNYVTGLVSGLAATDHDNDYTLFVNLEDRARVRSMIPSRFRVVAAAARPRITRLGFQQVLLPAMEVLYGLDVVHSPAFIAPLIKPAARHVVTIHDMTFFTRPDVHTRLRGSAAFRWAVARSIRECAAVAVPSEHTKADILRLLPGSVDEEDIIVTCAGIDDRFRPVEPDDIDSVRRTYELPEKFILFVGTIEPRKNLSRVLTAYAELAQTNRYEEHLVLVGNRGWEKDEVMQRMVGSAGAERVHVLGFVPNEHLPALYGGAQAFVFPSLEEGFGFPPLEAMACGTPVVTSNSSSLAENMEGYALLVEPTDTQAIRSAMQRLLDDPPLRESLRERGLQRAQFFRWEQAAVRMRACYESVNA